MGGGIASGGVPDRRLTNSQVLLKPLFYIYTSIPNSPYVFDIYYLNAPLQGFFPANIMLHSISKNYDLELMAIMFIPV